MGLLNWAIKYVIFKENHWNKFGTEDPYYEEYELEQWSFFGGTKKKKFKKPREIPKGLSENDTNILKKVMRRAYHLDMAFNFLGYRIGWNGIIGIIPVIGDFLAIFLSLMLYKLTFELDDGLPLFIHLKLLFNILLDFLLGLVPIVGDFIEVMYKSNSRNALILEKHLNTKSELELSKKENKHELKYNRNSRLNSNSSQESRAVIQEILKNQDEKSSKPSSSNPTNEIKIKERHHIGKDPEITNISFRERGLSK
ncbi:hypothetical protein WICMUC_001815 [Wickerhamomyces mucosus]|uniref:PH domain-containing protein n=1 Tax=Wickerhamomyces mucosus TaxID=1378264 RepID=A0A9P8PTY0_9ASCO|nr:hypothetical protein WICMUC_001815 [Wickerhamomyces mucosus]